jgi:hypothetical protein
MVCRGFLLALPRGGLIVLPAPRRKPPNNVVAHRRTARISPVDQRPLESTLAALGPVELRHVRRTGGEALFSELLAPHHYLGYCPEAIPGAALRCNDPAAIWCHRSLNCGPLCR